MDYYRGRKIDKKFKEEVAKNSAIRGYKNAVKIFIYRQDLDSLVLQSLPFFQTSHTS
jgi:hypothetical protein